MQKLYDYGPIKARVESNEPGTYTVFLVGDQITSSPILIDAHWGAQHASKLALQTYIHASIDPHGFMAQERVEASNHGASSKDAERWATIVIDESAILGEDLQEALDIASNQDPLDITKEVETYLELLEFSWEAEIESLIREGYSRQAAEEEVNRRDQDRSFKRWSLVPRLRPPRGVKA